MDDRFFNGIIGAGTSVCGYELQSLTPWHYILLQAIESPVLEASASTSVPDVLIFLKIASTTWPQVPNLRPRFRDAWWHWRMKNPKVATKQMRRLAEWIEAQLSVPQFWDDEKNKGSKLSSPPIFALVVGLVSKGNLSLANAWNMRMAEARWFDATLAELNGATLKIAYENESAEVERILGTMTEEDEIEAARKNLPPELFDRWLTARKNKQKEQSKQ